jgi:NAD-dependent dihydropyrimidine dehydrogenase PreA subunit
MTYVIAQPCVDVKDKACIEECPVDCIYEGERMLYIHPDECVDCGACEPVCPVEAIYYEDDVPSEWSDYYKANVEFFDDLGSPGGAAKLGLIPKDHSMVAALPPQAAEHWGIALPLSPPSLPDFPWDSLVPFRRTAAEHPDGLVDLSVGTPVDPTPTAVQAALAAAADSPGYPLTVGTSALREAVAAWFERRRGVPGVAPEAVLPTIGSKELVR